MGIYAVIENRYEIQHFNYAIVCENCQRLLEVSLQIGAQFIYTLKGRCKHCERNSHESNISNDG